MPCENCSCQFSIFKRKRLCPSCQRLFCSNCLSKRKKTICARCEIFLTRPYPTKKSLMELKTKDLIFYLQSKKIPIAGIVEKEELCNLIINHVNSSSYYEGATSFSSTSTTPNNDFENYTHSFDQIKNTCQSFISSITDKIASDLQKTTCFNQSANNPSNQQRSTTVTTEQPRQTQQQQSPSSSYREASTFNESARLNSNIVTTPVSPDELQNQPFEDCSCADDEMIEISEKRQSIFDGTAGPSGSGFTVRKKTKLAHSSSSGSSSFEELDPFTTKQTSSEDTWEVIEKSSSNGMSAVGNPSVDLVANGEALNSSPNLVFNVSSERNQTRSFIPEPSLLEANPEVRRLTRRRSDSSLLNLRKSSSITIDMAGFNPANSGNEVKKLKISCRKCGKAKTNIKQEILKLSEQLRTSNRSEQEVNDKIKEFLEYLECKSHASEMTQNSELSSEPDIDGARYMPSTSHSTSHDDIEESVFDDNEGIHVYPSVHLPPSAFASTPPKSFDGTKRFMLLEDIRSSDDLDAMTVKQLKEMLMLNRVDFKGCCEKQELKERVRRLWKEHVSAPPADKLLSDDLCKVCMDAPIECVFLECGHMATCTDCGKILHECPICRCYIVRIVRTFKS